ncbi:3-keto-5-aminohexanoate cleavage protein [Roseibium sp. SCPC15]|uniref:3-keto-5-aminohexanoate cleavage protein n=1 Tax=Roseibium sp. SCP15 TaxID=3141376 RepID=UPI003338F514
MPGQTELQPLPLIMVAPNGARKTKADHPALPMSIAETVEAAQACLEAGAGCLHAHVRDETGAHVLDVDLYKTLLAELEAKAPGMKVQITTETVGRYSPEDQRMLVREVQPPAVSIAIREMVPDDEFHDARNFYAWAYVEKIAVQHILYDTQDLLRFFELVEAGVIPGKEHQLLFVLGRYAANQESEPDDLGPYLTALAKGQGNLSLDWAVCAFGHRETECLVAAIEKGGKARIGLENGLWNRDGSLAKDNADRVRDLVAALEQKGLYT